VKATVEAVLRRIRPEGQELRFFRELAIGPIKRAATLDSIIQAYAGANLSEFEPRSLSALRVGTYELTFMEQASPYAAIETMAQAVRQWNPRAYQPVRDTLNAVFKGAGRFIREKPRGADRRCIMQVGPSLGRVFSKPVFPDPRSRRTDYLSAVYSLPLWLVRRLVGQYGDSFEDIAAALNSAPRNMITANTLRNDMKQLADVLARQGVATEREQSDDTLLLCEDVNIENLPAYLHGRFSFADEFDIGAADYLHACSGERICVLRGRTQTMARLAQAVAPEGRLTVCPADQAEARAFLLEIQRLGLQNVDIVVLDAYEATSVLDASFDRVFVEPSSSETGRLRHCVAARWRINERMLSSITERQKHLLAAAVELCAAGGVVVYVTGSLLPEENEQVVEPVVGPLQHLKIADMVTTLPNVDSSDGGFRARIVKFSTL
jgi:16S rRNA C967 or C1407 C5-methylase (RsmB/RsmF family)